MATVYFDTSYIAKFYFNEPDFLTVGETLTRARSWQASPYQVPGFAALRKTLDAPP